MLLGQTVGGFCTGQRTASLCHLLGLRTWNTSSKPYCLDDYRGSSKPIVSKIDRSVLATSQGLSLVKGRMSQPSSPGMARFREGITDSDSIEVKDTLRFQTGPRFSLTLAVVLKRLRQGSSQQLPCMDI